jgi:DNA-binding transcriptional LysR family regulator
MTKQNAATAAERNNVPPWDLIRAFLLLNRCGDYEIAAEKERIDDSTLRRRIRALEQRFGRALFVRNEGCWCVSPDVQPLLDAAVRMEEAARSFAKDPHLGGGMVRISVLEAFANLFCPVFVQFRERHPQIQLRITTEGYFVDLEQEKVDIALRLARPIKNGSSLRIRKIGAVPVNAYASRAYLDQDGGARRDRNFSCHQLLAINTQFSHLDHEFPYAELSSEVLGLRGDVVMSSDNFSVLARLCQLGHGVAVLPVWYAKSIPELEALQTSNPSATTELWMVSRLDLRAGWQRDLATMLQRELLARSI